MTNHANTAYVSEGDSITAGVGSTVVLGGYGYRFNNAASPPLGYFLNNAQSGSRLSILSPQPTLVSRAAALDALLPIKPLNILSVLIGANDTLTSLNALSPYVTAQDYADALASYLDARRAAGWKVILCTIMTQSNTDGSLTPKTLLFNFAVNTITRAWPAGLHFDVLCDFGADTIFGSYTSFYDYPTYWNPFDATHPSDIGQGLLLSIITPVIEGLIEASLPNSSSRGIRKIRGVNRQPRDIKQLSSVKR